MKRPSHKELYNKLREARMAVSKGLIILLNQDIIAADAIELEYTIGTELIPILQELLDYTTQIIPPDLGPHRNLINVKLKD